MAYRRVFVDRRFATAGPAGVTFCLAADDDFGAEGESIEKMNLLPRPPLLGEVASSVSEDDGEVVWKCSLPMRQAADGFAPHQHFPPIRRRGEVGEGGIEVLGHALPGGEAGAAQAGRDGRQDTVPGHGGAGNKAYPQRRDGQGSGPREVLLR